MTTQALVDTKPAAASSASPTLSASDAAIQNAKITTLKSVPAFVPEPRPVDIVVDPNDVSNYSVKNGSVRVDHAHIEARRLAMIAAVWTFLLTWALWTIWVVSGWLK